MRVYNVGTMRPQSAVCAVIIIIVTRSDENYENADDSRVPEVI